MKPLDIALVGNPNAGKSSLFVHLTGLMVPIANYPGVTIEKHQAFLQSTLQATLQNTVKQPLYRFTDLPGTFSLKPQSPEEKITCQSLWGDLHETPAPDILLQVIDGNMLARSLYLTLQLKRLKKPLLLAINHLEHYANSEQESLQASLEKQLNQPVVIFSVPQKTGTDKLLLKLEKLTQQLQHQTNKQTFRLLHTAHPSKPQNALLTRLWPHCHEELQKILLTLDAEISTHEASHPGLLHSLLLGYLKPCQQLLPAEELKRLESIVAQLHQPQNGSSHWQALQALLITEDYRCVDTILQKQADADTLLQGVDNQQRRQAPEVLLEPKPMQISQMLDKVLLHPRYGMLLWLGSMFCLLHLVFLCSEPIVQLSNHLLERASSHLLAKHPEARLYQLLAEGLLPGIHTLVCFVPQLFALFWGLGFLESSGYLARAAVLCHRWLCRMGLNGQSLLPLTSSFACAIPGIMACRTIVSPRKRLHTMFIAPWMSCSARLPIYMLLASQLFEHQQNRSRANLWASLSIVAMYGLGIFLALCSAKLLALTTRYHSPNNQQEDDPPWALMLPHYQLPNIGAITNQALGKVALFIKQTGPVILSFAILMWFFLHAPQLTCHNSDRSICQAEQLEYAYAGHFGHALEPVFAPLGFDWKIIVGLLASFLAREVMLSTLSQIYSQAMPPLSPLSALSLMVFFALALQCSSSIVTFYRESKSWRWTLFQVLYMNSVAYGVSFIIYQGGTWLLK